MDFCPNCEKTLAFVMGVGYRCPKCGYTTATQKTESNGKTIGKSKKMINPIIISDSRETTFHTLPTMNVNCSNCTNSTATFRTQAVGKDDDVLIIHLFRCTQCGYQWRQEE
jgi:DNA-directed RNA polymerase subunit M/transcription elongation factor TFIIS